MSPPTPPPSPSQTILNYCAVRLKLAVSFSIELDPCTEDKKCKQKHQTCKDIKGELLCDCIDGFIRKAHQCKGKLPFKKM